jgi:transposase-like protein
MYSYEDRIRAVELYIKLGKRLAATIRWLGYPTKNSLKSWYREYEQCHDVRAGYRTRIVRVIAEARGQRAMIESLDTAGRAFVSTVKWGSLHELGAQFF